MKPLLRVVLILDALLLLAFGLLFLLTPWASLYNALQLVQTEPVLIGQAFGVALIGLAWLAVHASFDGAMTSTVAKVVGHVHWLTGVLMLVWLLGMRSPSLTGFGQIVAVLAGAVLVVIGLGGVRLSGAVRRREKGIVGKSSSGKADKSADRSADKRADKRADKQAARDAGNEAEREAARRRELEREPRATSDFPGYRAEPVLEPVMPATRPVNPVAAASAAPAAGSASAVNPGSAAPLRSAAGDAALSESERAARAAAAAPGDTRNDAPGTSRPPFHG
ncbi:hypothetical protein [Paraburkholderia susongensis]|uniref:Transmembrane protein n=1 Tax=Paraburkholderia susongensis TaxID=1515439 RepID=A0A1X7I1N3_9BURK|nr:hypothetical protein [Paraburkholderia susongensis]SMG07551.1 hypothetical protein SAMN06265784_101179 [Paraburkholderia susongensis]